MKSLESRASREQSDGGPLRDQGARFIALPVGQGDAFFLETRKGAVLVDGRRSAQGLPDLFRTYTGRSEVDVLIVSHNDADHANGVLRFLGAGLRCREVWLPGRWLQVLGQVLRPWEEVVHLLYTQADELVREMQIGPEDHTVREESVGSLLEELAGKAELEPEKGRQMEVGKDGWPEELVPQLERLSWEWPISPWPLWWEWWWAVWACALDAKGRLFSEALVAGARIRGIAREAYHRGIPVRWWQWEPSGVRGGLPWLKPLNSRCVARVLVAPEKQFLKALALTTTNRESLVFWAPEKYAGRGVLFTSDSDLRDVSLPPLEGAIVTAPHHGSGTNRMVYQRIREGVIWVRSDGNFRGRPCREYLSARGQRYCTICRNSGRPKQAVIFYARGGTWTPASSVQSCICQ